MFNWHSSRLPGVFELRPRVLEDARGHFVKIFHRPSFAELGLATDWREQYYSVSRRDVLRGLHFQRPPHDHDKLVYVTAGTILDVVVDLRTSSPAFGSFASFSLTAEAANMVYIPHGCAHGFLTQSDFATVHYNVSTAYSPTYDDGLRWDSCGIPWPIERPIVSERDAGLTSFFHFETPFP